MKRIFKLKKNIILSLVLAFMLFLGIGVSVPINTASAEISGSIYDYEWANYFNFNNVNISALSDQVGYTTDKNTASQSIICTVSNADLFSTLSYLTIDAIANTDRVDLSVLPDLIESEYYTFSCTVRSNRDLDLDFNYAVLQIGVFKNNAFQPIIYNSESYQYYDSYSPSNYTSGNIYYRLLMYLDSGETAFQNGDTIIFENLTVNHGTDIYSYSPYFNSLNNLPNPLPDVVYPPSDDSGSGDSGSEDSGSEDSGSGDSESDDGVYSDGYADGYADGERAGYDQGYADGLKYAESGFFVNAVVNLVTVANENADWIITRIYPNLLYGGFDFSNIYSSYSSDYVYLSFIVIQLQVNVPYTQVNLNGVGVDMAFSQPWSAYDDTSSGNLSYLDLRWTNSSIIDDMPLYVSRLRTDGSIIDIDNSTVNVISSGRYSSFEYLNGLKVFIADNLYQSGYENGYNSGILSNNSDIYNQGLEEGKIIGEDIGFKKGLSQGMSGDPYSLAEFMYTFIDMPGRILSNLLNFEFMGLNLMGLVTFLLSIALVAFVLKKVV